MPFISSIEGNFSPVGRSRKPKNFATGGTTTTFSSGGKNYRRHVFNSAGSITLNVVTGIDPFTVALIGAGGSGGGGFIGAAGYSGGSGGGGGGWEFTAALSSGNNSGTVGAGGPASSYNGGGTTGGSTIFAGVTVGGGGGGQNGQNIQDTGTRAIAGGTGTYGGNSNGGTGSIVTFPGQTLRNTYSLGTIGAGGGGGGQDGPGGGSAGQPGAIVITYEID